MSWEKVKLDDIAKINKGKKHEEIPFSDGVTRYIQIEDLHGGINYRYTNELGVVVNKSDIIIAWDGANAGKVCVGLEGTIGSTLARIRFISNDVNPNYVNRFLSSKFEEIKRQRTGATIPHVNGTALRNIEIPLPPLHIQQHIAEVLDKADALRQKDQLLLQKYDELAQTIFYDMFGDPVKNEKGWEVKKIRELVTEVKYGTSAPATEIGDYPYLRMNNITFGGELNLSDLKRINASDEEYKKYGTRRGDLLFNRTNSKELVGKTTVVDTDEKMIIAGYLIRVRFNKNVLPEFVCSFLNCRHGKMLLQSMCKNIIGMANINAQELQNIEIIQPPILLQELFVRRIKSIKTIKINQNLTLDTSNSLFKGLLQSSFNN